MLVLSSIFIHTITHGRASECSIIRRYRDGRRSESLEAHFLVSDAHRNFGETFANHRSTVREFKPIDDANASVDGKSDAVGGYDRGWSAGRVDRCVAWWCAHLGNQKVTRQHLMRVKLGCLLGRHELGPLIAKRLGADFSNEN